MGDARRLGGIEDIFGMETGSWCISISGWMVSSNGEIASRGAS